jgi:hypothetical protein
MSVSRTTDIFGDWGYRYLEKTYVGGIGQKMKPLLDAEELAGNSNGFAASISAGLPVAEASASFFFWELEIQGSGHFSSAGRRGPQVPVYQRSWVGRRLCQNGVPGQS